MYQVDRRDLTVCIRLYDHCDLTIYLSTSYHVFEIYISTLIAAFMLGPLSFLQYGSGFDCSRIDVSLKIIVFYFFHSNL
jgi:hypothetical protein